MGEIATGAGPSGWGGVPIQTVWRPAPHQRRCPTGWARVSGVASVSKRQGFRRIPPQEENGFCWCGCGHELTGRQRRYASEACRESYWGRFDWGILRHSILRRDNNTCVLCGAGAQEVDHIIPVAKGGSEFDADNCRSLCHKCHVAVKRLQFPPRPKPPKPIPMSYRERMMARGQPLLLQEEPCSYH